MVAVRLLMPSGSFTGVFFEGGIGYYCNSQEHDSSCNIKSFEWSNLNTHDLFLAKSKLMIREIKAPINPNITFIGSRVSMPEKSGASTLARKTRLRFEVNSVSCLSWPLVSIDFSLS